MDKNIPRIGIGIFVFKEGKFLMGLRKGSHGENTWSIPGGHLEFGETIEMASEREAFEETGVKITNIRFAGVTNDIFEEEGKHYITIWMISDWKSGKERIMEPDKFLDFSWKDFDSLPSPLFLPWNQLLNSDIVEDIKKNLAENSH